MPLAGAVKRRYLLLLRRCTPAELDLTPESGSNGSNKSVRGTREPQIGRQFNLTLSLTG
jgi:hypothetical protein